MSDVECRGCGTPYKLQAMFCAKCGARREPLRAEPGFSLRATFVVYFALLTASIVAAAYSKVTGEEFGPVIVATSAHCAIAFVAAIAARRLVGPSLRGFGFGSRGLALVLVLAPVIVALIALYVKGMYSFIGIRVEHELAFADGHSLALAVIAIVVLAPVGEELAFRGLVFPGLVKQLGVTEGFAITAFAFGILHLSVPSLVTHVPLGLYLCWLRHRSGSLWPPVLAHALHNLGVVVVELYVS